MFLVENKLLNIISLYRKQHVPRYHTHSTAEQTCVRRRPQSLPVIIQQK